MPWLELKTFELLLFLDSESTLCVLPPGSESTLCVLRPGTVFTPGETVLFVVLSSEILFTDKEILFYNLI